MSAAYRARSFLYNERTGKWADVHGDQVFPQAVGPYGRHPVEGIYHPKRAGNYANALR